MKNGTEIIKIFIKLMLSTLLVLGLAACSQGKLPDSSMNVEGKDNMEIGMQPSTVTDGESAVQYAYSSTVIDFMEYGSDVVVLDIAGKGDQIYVLMEIRSWGAEPEDNTQKQESSSYYQVFSCMADGSGKAVSKVIYLPERSGYVNELHLSDSGCVAALFHSDKDDTVSLMFWDGFHDIHWEKMVASGGYLFLQEDGFVILARGGEERVANFYDAQGELTGSVEVEGNIFSNFRNCFVLPDNRFLVIKTDSKGMPYAESYDPQTGQGERKELPDSFLQYQVFRGTVADIVLCDSTGVYQMNLDGSAPTEILDFVDADLDIDGFQMAQQIDATCLAGIFNIGGVVKLGLFGRSEAPGGSQKKIIVLGTMSEMDADLRSRIISFNQTNSQYRITIKQYIAYDKELSALTQLNNDIISGKMPDILLIDDSMPLQSYISKGLLADVGKLIEEDEELDSGQFMENIFDAFRVKGTLYYVAPAFAVDTLVAKQSRVGDRVGWNQEEFSAVTAGLPRDTEVISETSRYGYLEDYMRVCGREYVNMDQGKCNFQSEAFVSALQFAATLPEYAERMDYDENTYDSRYIEDRVLLQPVTIRRVSDLAQQISGCIGEEIAYVGYPAESREGSCIRIYGRSFVLSGQGSGLEGAWEFARYFLTADYQRDEMYGGGLPTRQDIFDEKAQEAAAYEGYCFVNDEFIPVVPMTQGQIDRAVGFIKGLHNPAFEDAVIMNIIREEAESFFRGRRTAEDVAGLIQNRAQLYLSEGM